MCLSQPIPLEIISLVLSFLNPDDDEDQSCLIACGLVSRAFMTESRCRAFRTVRFSTMDEWRVPSFFRLIGSPRCSITRHVVSLECYGSAGVCTDGVACTEPRRWQANVLGTGISQLFNLKSLHLQSFIFDDCITPEAVQLFAKHLRASKITALHLQFVTFKSFTYLCEIIAALPTVETIAIKDCFFYNVDKPAQDYEIFVPSVTKLREFMLCWSEISVGEQVGAIQPSPLAWLLEHKTDLPKLEHVSFHVKTTRSQLFEETSRFLEVLGPTLKTFHFLEYLPHGSQKSNNIVSLKSNTSLRRLTMPFTITPQPSLPAILRTANSPELEEIYVTAFSMHPAVTYINVDLRVLQELDEVLHLPSLKSVKKLLFYLGMNQTSRLHNVVMDAMPRATERGILFFDEPHACCRQHNHAAKGTWVH